jgi:hypothetical protein
MSYPLGLRYYFDFQQQNSYPAGLISDAAALQQRLTGV